MDYDQKNVIVGVGRLMVDDVSVGYTQGGVTLSLATDRIDKEVDQSFSPVGILKVRERYQIQTNLAEATLENLKLVWEQTAPIVTGPSEKSMNWGINESVVEHTLKFYGKSPDGFDRVFEVFKAVVMEVGEMPHQRDAITVIPVTFRILPDTSKNAGEEYGMITDEVLATPDISAQDAVAVTEDKTISVI